ncbi:MULTISPECIES: DUF6602 domain-containing protein [Paraburkholderia]|uniref:DUF6602 domain-containing protein n=1 Tax=Paraburkholderia madseniana TaxID=2599607 RepID=A0AAP5BF15_9BURK|nr:MULTISPECIES: DUF6602 domain-containing protein [Paraburkholderia]MCX4146898.1 hypothetical protein [Paraburkholderia madseniana]MDN7149844.1 hypothetical protein [Paraburkholderia sp. WS6]MDQ6408724.1 hypothetical protein [Paraburkholderia madseniana]
MPKPPVDVRKLLQATASTMWAAFQLSDASARPDHKGLPREADVRAFLRDRLPRKFGVARGHVIQADRASLEFDVIVYDALNCPTWAMDSSGDPRLLVPIEAVVGVIEVKSKLTTDKLRLACAKLAEFDEHLQAAEIQLPHRAFRAVFAYSLGGGDTFNDWRSPDIFLTRYAAEVACQPDALFVLDSHFSLLISSQSVGKAYALHWGVSVDEVWAGDNREPELEQERRDFYQDQPEYTLDYFVSPATNGLLLAFFTFVLEEAERYTPRAVSYADRFYTWGGPGLGGLVTWIEPGADLAKDLLK